MAIWQRDDRDFFLSPIDGLWDQGYLIICSDPGDITVQHSPNYCCIHEQKESSKGIYCIFILLVASHKYLQYAMFKYTNIRWTHNSELTFHCSTIINLEDKSMSILSDSTASRWSPSVLSTSPVFSHSLPLSSPY